MILDPTQFRADHPGLFFLDPTDRRSLENYLRQRNVLSPSCRVVSVAKAGDSNMNCAVRVTTQASSLIVKQSRPWVEKFPQFAAPWDRACREAEFYRRIESHPEVACFMPRLIGFDPDARVLVLEDLGTCSDYTSLYRGEILTSTEIESMARFLFRLHQDIREPIKASRLSNREMRELNHGHIFVIPFAPENGLQLDRITPGLATVAGALQSDIALVREINRLGQEVYLADGEVLIHGDFFPGSLLRTNAGPRVIDPEFAFFGPAEFDPGVFLAHLFLSNQPLEWVNRWLGLFSSRSAYDERLILQVTGAEIIRRLIGYAQLPIGYGLNRKMELLEFSSRLVLHPSEALLALK